ncbi:PHP domain-containing protein [Candidatus Kaiserbacteria bacterium]|nr:MAG: PHP domain-containing protein [Candidatus Kaiserbacteria bacterium]
MELTGIMHCHASYSYDAQMSLLEIKALCQKKGIQFVCMTEHTDELTPERAADFVRECGVLSDDTFLFIPGFEVPFMKAHILMIGERTFSGTYAGTIDALKKWTSTAPFVVLAHPVRNHFEVRDALLEEIDALEVWNQQYEGKRVPRTRSLRLFDTLRLKKPALVATGGVDFHRAPHFGAPFITLNATVFSEFDILEKLKIGAFRIHSDEASLYGVLPNAPALISLYRWKSLRSVWIITVGKWVNALLAQLGIRFPKQLTQFVRSRV